MELMKKSSTFSNLSMDPWPQLYDYTSKGWSSVTTHQQSILGSTIPKRYFVIQFQHLLWNDETSAIGSMLTFNYGDAVRDQLSLVIPPDSDMVILKNFIRTSIFDPPSVTPSSSSTACSI